MSRVFVSCAVRDRAVGDRLGSLVRSLGHDAADDQDDAQGTAWWNEVVGRIEGSDVFVAVASPAYAEAHSCRLAAKHAAATGLPVVRVDLDPAVATGCHPVVAEAVGVPYAPEDPEVVARLAQALIASPDAPHEEAATAPAPDLLAAAPPPTLPPPAVPSGARPAAPGGFSPTEMALALLMVVSLLGLAWIGLSTLGGSDPEPGSAPVTDARGSGAAPEVTEAAPASTSASAAPESGGPTAAAASLLAGLGLVGSDLLPVEACQAGAGSVTCSRPATNISTVVLTPYETPAELYAAYTDQVESLSGQPLTENAGNCSPTQSEGELGWNLDKEHTLDVSLAQQEQGGLDPAGESAGRVFCTADQEVMRLVWTQDPGLLVTVTGQPSATVVTWWSEVHLQLACAAGLVGSGCA